MGAVLDVDASDGLSLDVVQAERAGTALASGYAAAQPFPHAVMDDFLPDIVARHALEDFPQESRPSDMTFEMGYAGHYKRQIMPDECNARARELFRFLCSAPMLGFLEKLSGIEGLIPDPYFTGGGYHETRTGGKLGIHADFRVHERLRLHRRLNLILYLNENWPDAYGGQLELWDKRMEKKVVSVAPIFNRCVVFNTDATSYHGHPDPLQSPADVSRKSIALYYYTASKAILNEIPNVSTMYFARPEDDNKNKREALALRLEQYANQWVPPILLRYWGALRYRMGARRH